MSDGHNATPGRGRAPHADGDGELTSRVPQRSPSAAPWERFSAQYSLATRERPALQVTPDGDYDHAEPGGCHTTGELTVAELIARVGGRSGIRPSRHHAAPDVEPLDSPGHGAHDPTPVAYSALVDTELFEPESPHRPHSTKQQDDVEQTTVLPTASERVPPVRIRRTSALQEPPPKPRRRRLVLLAGRVVAALLAVLALATTGGAWQWSTSKTTASTPSARWIPTRAMSSTRMRSSATRIS